MIIKLAAKLVNKKGALSLIDLIKKSYKNGNFMNRTIEKNEPILKRIEGSIENKNHIGKVMGRRMDAVESFAKKKLRSGK